MNSKEQSYLSSYIEAQSSKESVDAEIDKFIPDMIAERQFIEDKLSLFIQIEYHDVIVCDISAYDPSLYLQIQQLQEKIRQEEVQKAQIASKYNQNLMNIKEIKKNIQALEEIQSKIKNINQEKSLKDVDKKYLNINEILAKQEEDIKLKIKTEKMEELIISKENKQKAVSQFLQRQMLKQEMKIAQLQLSIEKEKLLNQKKEDKLLQMMKSDDRARFINDRKEALKVSIANMKKYIQMNQYA